MSARLCLLCCFSTLLVALGACGARGAARLSGTPLANTGDVAASAEHNFALSPDGAWLSFTPLTDDGFRPAFVLYNLRTGERHLAQPDARTAELGAGGLGPLRQAGCWSDDSNSVTLPGDVAIFTVAPVGPGAQIVAQDATPAQQGVLAGCRQDAGGPPQSVQVQQLGAGEVALLHDGQQIARFSSSNPTVTAVEVRYLSFAPGGSHIAYEVVERQGSFVASRGYVQQLAASASPLLLAEPVFGPLRFGYDGTSLYGLTRTAAGDSIYRWDIAP
jgi:hypothetical protein